uniref:Uncharacterized protein n=1 Tax=Timema poppense TaxID=170557 RepID=A0A7R9GUH8_TIMPO|nr:unnamed protein product [Timema poppensis]
MLDSSVHTHCPGATPWRRPNRTFRAVSVLEGGKDSLVLVYTKRAWDQITSRDGSLLLSIVTTVVPGHYSFAKASGKQWAKECMKSAVNSVRRKEMGSLKASRIDFPLRPQNEDSFNENIESSTVGNAGKSVKNN